ncbi:MAG: glucose-6-phosphate isomerase [Dongiaceae bacterium]
MPLPFRASIESFYPATSKAFAAASAQAALVLNKLAAGLDKKPLAIFEAATKTGDLENLAPLAAHYRQFKNVLILGTGGSSLGGKALYALANRGFGAKRGFPKLYFLDNVDPDTFEQAFAKLDPRETGVIAISKSGSTAETLCQLGVILSWLKDQDLTQHIALLTEPAENPLRQLGKKLKLTIIEHHPQIGGRFSVFSNVGMLPALLAGLDAAALRQGAKAVLDEAKKGDSSLPAFQGAVFTMLLNQQHGVSQTVIMPYIDRLKYLAVWHRQLWAESLGKNGKGLTPIDALGAVDQHSQLQLYLDGPNDKFYTIITSQIAGSGPLVDSRLPEDARLGYFKNKRMGDLLAAEQQATIQTMVKAERPVRVIHCPQINEHCFGALLMHFMLETILTAELLGVDAFSQPAVEEGKAITRALMEKGFAA